MSTFDPHIVPGLQSTAYICERRHALLAADAHHGPAANIGRRGENLTITFLSLNRSGLSLSLLDSIARHMPDFRGEVLIVDNGSEPTEVQRLTEAAARQPFACRLVELGQNYGVAGGRNRSMPHVRSEWVLCLDNDMVFIADPLPAIQRDLALLGCHFLNLPLLERGGQRLFARGGHLYVCLAGAEIHIGAGSVYPPGPRPEGEGPPFLSTFLFGGASVFNRHTFERLGGYDEGMFLGFEDIDFSIRLFQAGLKVGNSSSIALVHDHPPPACDSDQDYERQRFSRAAIRRSAEYFEAKHGLKIWSDVVEQWLEARQHELGITEPPIHAPEPPPPMPAEARPRPRIALVIDTDDWAFGNISRQLQRHLSDRFDFLVVPMDVVDNIIQVLLMTDGCDLVHFFWREHLTLIQAPYFQEYVRNMLGDYDRFFAEHVRAKAITTSIYDHLLLDEPALTERRPLFTDLLDGYAVGSERLRRVYENLTGYPPPTAVTPDGVDRSLFYPQRLERFDSAEGRELVIGWVGNSQWAAELEDFKGVHTILRPALEQLRAEGLPLRAHFVDRAEGSFIPHERMVDYYAGIDVYVCTSKIEGTPNPVLECMACGVPVISTDVGIVPEAFGPRQQEFILPERSIECLQAALRRLLREPALFRILSEENLAASEAWDWRHKVESFAVFFEACLARARQRKVAHVA
jgi:glycosyltransferase involved in cell wall biosynthesis